MASATSVTSFNLLPPVLRRTIHEAYDDAMETLGTRQGCNQWLTYESMSMTVARHIVEKAKQGESDVERLRISALTAVHFHL
jgi:hypothetical protein